MKKETVKYIIPMANLQHTSL